MPGRRRLDKLESHDEADADEQENPPCGRKQVAQREQSSLDFRHHASLTGAKCLSLRHCRQEAEGITTSPASI
jgi:hypothetical protein